MINAFNNVLLTAMDNAREGITISDATLPDNPLIYVNKGFVNMTGYKPEDVLFKNCRFLQGDEADQVSVALLREAIAEQKPLQVELLNYHKNGSAFYNRLSITPLFDDGRLTHFIGVQEDITDLKQKQELQQKLERQKLIHQTSIQVQEQERETLGKELHDNINQLLATSRLFLKAEAATLEEQQALHHQSGLLIDEAIEEIRRLSRRLVQPQFNKKTLTATLESLVKGMQPALPFPIYLTAEVDEALLNNDKKTMVYRIVQEGLNNILKYAGATENCIGLETRGNELLLIIEDDGAGFDTATTTAGIGLRNISHRLEMEGGSVCIETAPGKGCSLLIAVPL